MGSAGPLVDECIGAASRLARHRYGSRALCAVLRSHFGGCGTDATTVVLVEELIESAHELLRDSYGCLVLNTVLDCGGEHERTKLADALRSDLVSYACDPVSVPLLAKALKLCGHRSRQALCKDILEQPRFRPGMLAFLAESSQGCQVVREFMRVPGAQIEAALQQLLEHEVHLQETRHGRRLMNDLNL